MILRQSLMAPACRMVVVAVYVNDDNAQVEFIPVVAIRSRVTAKFERSPRSTKEPGYDHGFYPSIRHAEAERFQHCDVIDEIIPVIVDQEFGVIAADDQWDASNGAYEIVACPWPIGEDTEKLGTATKRVEAAARKKAAAMESRLMEARRLATSEQFAKEPLLPCGPESGT